MVMRSRPRIDGHQRATACASRTPSRTPRTGPGPTACPRHPYPRCCAVRSTWSRSTSLRSVTAFGQRQPRHRTGLVALAPGHPLGNGNGLAEPEGAATSTARPRRCTRRGCGRSPDATPCPGSTTAWWPGTTAPVASPMLRRAARCVLSIRCPGMGYCPAPAGGTHCPSYG